VVEVCHPEGKRICVIVANDFGPRTRGVAGQLGTSFALETIYTLV